MIKVQCHSTGSEPVQAFEFSLNHHTYRAREILDRWYSDYAAYCKVRTEDGDIYILRHDKLKNEWDIVFYQNTLKRNAFDASCFAASSPSFPWIPEQKKHTIFLQ